MGDVGLGRFLRFDVRDLVQTLLVLVCCGVMWSNERKP